MIFKKENEVWDKETLEINRGAPQLCDSYTAHLIGIIPHSLLGWAECFLMNRHQRVKIGQSTTSWPEIWGTVPQGTLLGVLFFLCMINYLRTECHAIKYVDDTTISHVTNRSADLTLQQSVDTTIAWSESNSTRINAAKTKEMVMCFAKNEPNIPNITVGDTQLEQVADCKLLGVCLNNKLTWHTHVDYMHKRTCTRLHFLAQLRKTRMTSKVMVKVYTTLVRPLVEYASQVWNSNLTGEQSTIIESIQDKALLKE